MKRSVDVDEIWIDVKFMAKGLLLGASIVIAMVIFDIYPTNWLNCVLDNQDTQVRCHLSEGRR